MLEQRCGRISHVFRLRAADGHYFWYTLKARPVVGPDGEVVRVVGTLSDCTESKTAEERLLHDAVHDNLTGLPNRELFFDRLDAALTMGQGVGASRPTVITLDIDRFKTPTRQVGPSVGDSILLTLARRLGRLLRQQDTMARIGGDQFAFIIMSEQNVEAVVALADTLRRTLATPITFGDHEIALTCSGGLAPYDPGVHAKRETMLSDAEIAMTHAKRVRRRSHRGVPSGHAGGAQRSGSRWKADLRRAVERNEIKVHFQPIVRLEDRTIAGFEALLRWTHPRLGAVPPSEFIPVAEQTGLIVDLGLFALDRTARELAAWAGGARRPSADLRQRERVVTPAAAPRSAQRRQGGADALGGAARLAEARAHREPGDGEPPNMPPRCSAASAISGPGCRSTISARATRR